MRIVNETEAGNSVQISDWVHMKTKCSSRCHSTGCVVGVSDRRRFEGVPEGFVSFG
jgi:hypothetical protein